MSTDTGRVAGNLADVIFHNLRAHTKQALYPMPGGQPPAAAGMPSPEAVPQPGAPAESGLPPPGVPPPGPTPVEAGAPPVPAGPPPQEQLYDMIVQAVRQVQQETGALQPQQPAQAPAQQGAGGKDLNDRVARLEAGLGRLVEEMGLVSPSEIMPQEPQQAQGQAPQAMGAGSALPGDATAALARGPMSAGANAAIPGAVQTGQRMARAAKSAGVSQEWIQALARVRKDLRGGV